MIPDFSLLVVDGDCREGGGACWYCQALLGQPHIPLSELVECPELQGRIDVRHRLAARAHLYSRHEATEAFDAERHQADRDGWIAQLKAAGRYDRTALMAALGEQSATVAASIRSEEGFRHLNAGWDGRGVKPSLLASIREAAARCPA